MDELVGFGNLCSSAWGRDVLLANHISLHFRGNAGWSQRLVALNKAKLSAWAFVNTGITASKAEQSCLTVKTHSLKSMKQKCLVIDRTIFLQRLQQKYVENKSNHSMIQSLLSESGKNDNKVEGNKNSDRVLVSLKIVLLIPGTKTRQNEIWKWKWARIKV